ncbi:MAG: alanine--tRNA ligase-related protein, partial [Kiritimatiellia bacterium]
LFLPLLAKIRELTTVVLPDEKRIKAERIIADHMRTATIILGDPKGGVKPGNVGANYVLRRLIRRAVRYAKDLGLPSGFTATMAEIVLKTYLHFYPDLTEKRALILEELTAEESRFEKTLVQGRHEFEKVAAVMQEHGQTQISGKTAFKLYDTYGFPLEMTQEFASELNMTVDAEGFVAAEAKHKEASKQGDAIFKGGLADHSEQTTRLHTATHLLHKALKMVLGEHVNQKGSNITVERLRFDFSHPEKMTAEQLAKVEDIVNEQITRALPIVCETMSIESAKNSGATALFSAKYGEQVRVYSMGDFSKEVCGGPHAENTSELIAFKILKEESSSAGVRRIKAIIGEEAKAKRLGK